MHKILRLRAFVTCCFLFLTGAALAQKTPAEQEAQNTWFKQFHRTQDLKPFDAFWKEVISQNLLEQENRISPILGFASQVLHQHPELLKGRIESVKAFPEKQRDIIRSLLWLSNTDEARKILQADSPEEALRAPPPIHEWAIQNASDLDLCWGWFFATGDTDALKPITSALDFGEHAGALKRYKTSAKTKADEAAAYKDAIFGAAMWSLEANGKENPLVSGHIEKAFHDDATPKPRGIWLAILLSKIMPQRYEVNLKEGKVEVRKKEAPGPQNTVDGFMALIVATTDSDWQAKWDTPADTTPRFTPATQLKIGERATVLVFFANPQSAPESGINVTYDMKIIRPNGRITENKNLKGFVGTLKGPLTHLHLMHDLIGFAGEKSDPAGEWIFQATVHDNVRKTDVLVTTRFVLETQ